MAGNNFNLQRILGNIPGMGGGGQQGPEPDAPLADTAEQVYISSMALLKMLKHGRAGVPMEVMGLMLGEFIDDYTVRVVDVFSMPQSGNSVTVEAVDPVFQTKMLDMLKQTGRPEVVVGWYHSHPGFGCWFSSTDINTQQSFEQLNSRAVGVVIDPIQSVKGKVVIDCFRLINPQLLIIGQEPRQTTSVVGNLHKRKWLSGLELNDFTEHAKTNAETVNSVTELTRKYKNLIEDELKYSESELVVRNVGKVDPKKGLSKDVDTLLTT